MMFLAGSESAPADDDVTAETAVLVLKTKWRGSSPPESAVLTAEGQAWAMERTTEDRQCISYACGGRGEHGGEDALTGDIFPEAKIKR